ncbi:MAG: HD domain-containing protein, partial [Elusimicrobia bacterium]|nr:HD domain-containing protein [Elusimicrobiota bacterium]MBD3412507.1 HD domain-containing protein [Elusimicrobiota bacterium]
MVRKKITDHNIITTIISTCAGCASINEKLYIVGGYLRDRALGRKTNDIDIVAFPSTTRLVECIEKRVKSRAFTIDKQKRTVRIMPPGTNVHLDFSRPQGKTILDDLCSRDLTINAMARQIIKTKPGKLIDPFEGKKDIHNKTIRFIAEQALIHDPLRLLRAHRFAAELGFHIEKHSRSLIHKHCYRIKQCSGERIRDELIKIFESPRAGQTFKDMDTTQVLKEILPEVHACRNVATVYYPKQGLITHCINSVENMEYLFQNISHLFGRHAPRIVSYVKKVDQEGVSRKALLKYAALLHDIGKPKTAKKIKGRLRFFMHEETGAVLIKAIASRMRMSNRHMAFLQTVARAHMRPGNLAHVEHITDRAIHRFFYDYGEHALGVLLVSLADRFFYLSRKTIRAKTDRHQNAILYIINRFFSRKSTILPKPLINGHQLMKALD